MFVHEWAHLRYGVFDEYGTAGDPNYPLFYLPPQSQSIQPNVCANKPIKYRIIDISNNSPNCKIDPITKIYDKNCRFVFDDDFKPTSSLSSYHQLDSIVHFCRDDQDLRHKHELPNRHNQMCSGRSAWSVIMDHSDFAFGKYVVLSKPNNLLFLNNYFAFVGARKAISTIYPSTFKS